MKKVYEKGKPVQIIEDDKPADKKKNDKKKPAKASEEK